MARQIPLHNCAASGFLPFQLASSVSRCPCHAKDTVLPPHPNRSKISSCNYGHLAFLVFQLPVDKRLPPKIPCCCLMNGPGNVAEVGGYVVFEAFAADVLQQLLQLRNLGYARAAEGLERIVGEFTWKLRCSRESRRSDHRSSSAHIQHQPVSGDFEDGFKNLGLQTQQLHEAPPGCVVPGRHLAQTSELGHGSCRLR